jgi:hypothetical protein
MVEAMAGIDGAVWLGFALTVASSVFVAHDLATRTPEMRVMKCGCVLTALDLGPIGRT